MKVKELHNQLSLAILRGESDSDVLIESTDNEYAPANVNLVARLNADQCSCGKHLPALILYATANPIDDVTKVFPLQHERNCGSLQNVPTDCNCSATI